MRQIAIKLIIFILCAVLLSACQPSPEEFIVINKGNDNLEKVIQETPMPENTNSFQTPNSWQEVVQSKVGNFEINIDAQINVSNASSYSVYEIAPVPFTEDQIADICRVLFDGREIYELNKERSKEDYQDMVFEQKAYLAELQRHKDDSSLSKEEYDEEVNRIKRLIEKYSAEYENAPDTVKRTLIDEIEFSNFEAWDGINIMSKIDDGKWDYLSVANGENNLGNNLVYYIDSIQRDLAPQIFRGDCIDGLSLSLEDAEIISNELIEELGLSNKFSIYAVYTEGYNKSETYMIRYAMTLEGVQESLIDANWGGYSAVYADQAETIESHSEEYREPWSYGYIEISVKEDGIQSFIWQRPGKIVKTINQNVTILSFEEIQEIFKNQICIRNFEISKSDVIEINIDKAALSLMRVPIKHTSREYYLLPVWDFFGEIIITNGTILVNDDSFLTINAIDGSIIDRNLGY